MTAALKGLLLLGTLVLGAWLGYAWRDAEADKQMAYVEAQQAKSQKLAVSKALAKLATQTHRIQEASDAEHFRRVAAEATLRRADAAGRGLRDELQATRTWARGLDSQVAGERAAAIAAVDLLTGLLERCSDERRAIAKFADDAAGAGKTCERAFDALTDGADGTD